MDRAGSSKNPDDPGRAFDENQAKKVPDETPPRKRERKNEDDIPEDSDDEDNRADIGGSRNYPTALWNRLKNPPNNRPTIDVWEFKMDGEVVTMTFTCDGEKYPMYFTPRSAIDYQMRSGYWIPRHNPMFAALRTRIYSLPKNTTFNRLVFSNTPECEAEDCLIEFMFIKKWTCKQLEYTICTEFNQPQHLRKLVHMFKPMDITVTLNFGPYSPPNHPNHGEVAVHNHLAACFDTTVELEKDFRVDCANALNEQQKKELQHLYGEAGRGKAFGVQMLRTLTALRKFVVMMADKKMAQTKGLSVRKFIVNGPTHDKLCPKLQMLFKDEGMEEGNKKRIAYANGDKIFVCVRSEMRRAYKYTLAMPATAFKMHIGNDQLLTFTKTVGTFHCLFRTNVDERGVVQLISEWQRGDRSFDDVQLHLDKVIETNFVDHLGADHQDPKRIKIRRVMNGKKLTMYIERERLATRHLSLRVIETK
ncbi:hypothetical protein GCK72_015401 [Caenorhabditis remanei]|uniref:Uncharacterized protein n=1 Tax=Caenorhabditis remanei TaxID=31234 RepID=A0A6A5GWE1_CAERE|nr:hypothetical protein GCK72_015401 [Caenorhabditis remanei]KAF1758941.1 hypothetical protein GCK72_015401 [Caenorhabditis remanei]